MKPAREWMKDLADVALDERVVRVEGRGGEPTLRVDSVFLHSRYNPREEAVRLIDSAGLDLARPVLVVGLGLGYHVLELVARGGDVAVVEPDVRVGRLALEGPMRDSGVLMGVGDSEIIAASDVFREFVARSPQVLVHPPTARLHPAFAAAISEEAARGALNDRRLSVAVVGPLYGGSLPIARYLERGFARLGHRTLFVDNSIAWTLYESSTGSVKSAKAAGQLGALLTHFLSEWSYARVMEFAPDICIAVAQAPVGPGFPARLRKEGIVSAFWFVENWRHLPYWREIAPLYDHFFHIQPGEFEKQLREAGCVHHAYVQTGCDPEVHKPVALDASERKAFECDLSFAGAGYLNRIQVFRGLTDYDFKIWGVEWNALELAPLVCEEGVRFTPEQFAKIVAGSKINLNLHSSQTHEGVDPDCDAINPRVFEIAACGGFQLCDPCKGLESLFDFERELPVYHDLVELREKADYYLAHPDERKAIAQRARARVLQDHTYEKRAQQMLDALLSTHGKQMLKKGIRAQRTVGEMVERVGRDTPLGVHLASLSPDLLFTHENICERAPWMGIRPGYVEGVFAYLKELRTSAEALLALREE